MKKKGKYLGEMLVKKGLVSESQLEDVIREQLRNKKFLGQMLVDKGLIEEDDLFETIAEQFGIEFISLKDHDIDWEIALGFSSSMITEHKCMPLGQDQDTVTVAITNPLDVWVLDTAEKEASPRRLKVVLVTASDMDKAIKEYHRYSIRKMMNKLKKDK